MNTADFEADKSKNKIFSLLFLIPNKPQPNRLYSGYTSIQGILASVWRVSPRRSSTVIILALIGDQVGSLENNAANYST